MKKHWAIFTDNRSDKAYFIKRLLGEVPPSGFEGLSTKKGMLFSKLAIRKAIDAEMRHGIGTLTKSMKRALFTMSSGEQKKALLSHIIASNPDYIVLDNPFDNLDVTAQAELKIRLKEISGNTILIQLLGRTVDLLPFIENFAQLKRRELILQSDLSQIPTKVKLFTDAIPRPLSRISYSNDILIQLKDVSVSYMEKPVLGGINWTIKKGEFWELRGANGSGKTTILSMITGENPKGYGQGLYIFGKRKGSGESIWDIKKRIGYFTPSMTDSFSGYHSIKHMLISGLNDSIGLYTTPSEAQLRIAKEWLLLLNMWHQKDHLFHDLGTGQKRLIMCARAMIKHPIMLILDEPTAGLDDASAALFVSLVNKFSVESDTAIVFVSHRKEPGLTPEHMYQLEQGMKGSIGRVL